MGDPFSNPGHGSSPFKKDQEPSGQPILLGDIGNMRIEEEIDYLADILGREKPAVHKALLRVAGNPKEAGSVRDQFMLMLKRAGYDITDLPVFPVNIVQNQNDGVILGHAVLGNRIGGEVILSIKCLATPTLIAGITGSGKTTLMMWLAEQLQRI